VRLPERVIVLGAGAIGAPVGALLHDVGVPVVLVARGAHGQVMARDGLGVHRPGGSRRFRLPVRSRVEDAHPTPADLVLVSVMGHHTAEAIAAVPADVSVVSLQNGTAPISVLSSRGHPLLAGVVYVPAERWAPGEVDLSGVPHPGSFLLGDWPGAQNLPAGWAGWLAERLRAGGWQADLVGDAAPWVRAKLLCNLAGILVALCDAPPPALLEAVQAEARAVWDAAGLAHAPVAALIERTGMDGTAEVSGRTRRGGSTRHALRRGAPLETRCLHQPIIDAGARLGVPTPVNAALVRLAAQAERGGWRPGAMAASELAERANR